jgi:hypothetical protein
LVAKDELPPLADGWVRLFNGKDLTGWKINPDQVGHWEVKDGILIGSMRQSYLFSEMGDYVNFRLRAEAKINLGGESGICFRAPFALRRGKLAWQVRPDGGYAAELQKNLRNPRPTGSVFEELFVGERPIVLGRAADDSLTRPDEWFTLEIIAEQNRFITKVNGKETANCSDPLNKYPTGHIALEVWNPNTVVQFRKIEIKELPANTKPDALPPTVTNTLGMKFKLIPAGKFTMGSPKEEIDRCLKQFGPYKENLPTEGPEHPVEITQPFYLGATEVTVGQFRQFVDEEPIVRVNFSDIK